MKHLFLNRFMPVRSLPLQPTLDELAHEPSLLSADWNFALCHGGPLTKKIMTSYAFFSATQKGLQPIIDVRVQRLMPGMYPSIPGWHGDAVPRADYHSQPALQACSDDVCHYTVLLASERGVSCTEFVFDPLELTFTEGTPIWQQAHRQIEALKPPTIKCQEGMLYRFYQDSLHRATPCQKRGWRMFFRLSFLPTPPLNQVVTQQQVYLLSEENGW